MKGKEVPTASGSKGGNETVMLGRAGAALLLCFLHPASCTLDLGCGSSTAVRGGGGAALLQRVGTLLLRSWGCGVMGVAWGDEQEMGARGICS